MNVDWNNKAISNFPLFQSNVIFICIWTVIFCNVFPTKYIYHLWQSSKTVLLHSTLPILLFNIMKCTYYFLAQGTSLINSLPQTTYFVTWNTFLDVLKCLVIIIHMHCFHKYYGRMLLHMNISDVFRFFLCYPWDSNYQHFGFSQSLKGWANLKVESKAPIDVSRVVLTENNKFSRFKLPWAPLSLMISYMVPQSFQSVCVAPWTVDEGRAWNDSRTVLKVPGLYIAWLTSCVWRIPD